MGSLLALTLCLQQVVDVPESTIETRILLFSVDLRLRFQIYSSIESSECSSLLTLSPQVGAGEEARGDLLHDEHAVILPTMDYRH